MSFFNSLCESCNKPPAQNTQGSLLGAPVQSPMQSRSQSVTPQVPESKSGKQLTAAEIQAEIDAEKRLKTQMQSFIDKQIQIQTLAKQATQSKTAKTIKSKSQSLVPEMSQSPQQSVSAIVPLGPLQGSMQTPAGVPIPMAIRNSMSQQSQQQNSMMQPIHNTPEAIAQTEMKLSLTPAEIKTQTMVLSLNPILPAESKEKKSLYERLGGVYPIAAVVNLFSDSLFNNSVVGIYSENAELREWHSKTYVSRLPGLKFLRTLWVCAAAGGPFEYTAKDLKTAHAGLHIQPHEFDQVIVELAKALDYYKVPEPERGEVIQAFLKQKEDVTAGSQIPAQGQVQSHSAIRCPFM